MGKPGNTAGDSREHGWMRSGQNSDSADEKSIRKQLAISSGFVYNTSGLAPPIKCGVPKAVQVQGVR
jgi:hypothetical protein